jgi:hypothetical protein
MIKNLVDAKRKTKRKLKITQKSNKRSNLDHLLPGNGAIKRGLLVVNSYIKVRLDLQADKSSVIFKYLSSLEW